MKGIKSIFLKKQKKTDKAVKANIVTIFIENDKLKTMSNDNLIYNCSSKRKQQFDKLFEEEIINLDKLKNLTWQGIPHQYRSKIWKILLKYTSTNKSNQQHSLSIKRRDYYSMVQSYIESPYIQLDNNQKKIKKLIHDDVVRTMPESKLFRQIIIQNIMERILYIWHMRHPSSGYVQGLNDIVTPFIIVFLSEYIPISFQKIQGEAQISLISQNVLRNIEADTYWCFTKLLNEILDNYTNNWPGIQKAFVKVKNIISRVDPCLLKHFQSKQIDFYHIYFKWITCLLLRQFSLKTGLRLFDTYFSVKGDFFNFCSFLIIAIFLKYSEKLKKMSFEQIMTFEHNFPTKKWNQEQLSTIIAQAYVYQTFFENE